MNNILVLGGSGFVGRHVCEKLQQKGLRITVPTRRALNARAVQHLPGVTVLEANVHDPADLQRLLPGHDAVVNLIAILHGNEAAFESNHVALPERLAQACTHSGVRRLVHISALGVDTSSPSRYQRSKARGEAVLRAADLALTVLRPSVIFGADDRFLNLFARLQSVFPVMPLAGASARFQPVWVEDVAAAVVACLHHPQHQQGSVGQTYDCAGPQVLTLAELVRLSGRLSGHERPVLPLPMALGKLQALFMELAPGEPLMSRDNLDAMSVDNVATGQWPGLVELGIQPSAVQAVAASYLGGRNGRSALLGLRERAARR